MSLRHRILGAIGLTVVGFSTVTALTTPAGAETPPLPDTVANLTTGSPAPAPSEPITWYNDSVTTHVVFNCTGNLGLPIGSGFYLDCRDDYAKSFTVNMTLAYRSGFLEVRDGASFSSASTYSDSIYAMGALSTAPSMPIGLDYTDRTFVIGCVETHYPAFDYKGEHDTITCPLNSLQGLPNGSINMTRYERVLTGTVVAEGFGTLQTTAELMDMFVGPFDQPVSFTMASGSFTLWQQPVYEPTAPNQGEVAVGTPLSTDPSVVNPVVIGVPACLAATDGVVGDPAWAKPVGDEKLIADVYKDIPATTCTGV